MRAWWTLALVLLSLVPPSAGQVPPPTVTIDVKVPAEPLQPVFGQMRVAVSVRVSCNGEEGTRDQMMVRFQMTELPPYAAAVFEADTRSTVIEPYQCVPQLLPAIHNNITLTTTQDAPAFVDGSYKISVWVKKSQVGSEHGPFASTFKVTNGFLPDVAFAAHAYQVEAKAGKEARFGFNLYNNANSPVRVKVEPRQAPDGGLSLVAPGEFRLESNVTQGPSANYSATGVIVAKSPGGASAGRVFPFSARFTASYDGNGTDAPTQARDLEFQLRVIKGGLSPGPGVVWLALVGCVAAAWLRRRADG